MRVLPTPLDGSFGTSRRRQLKCQHLAGWGGTLWSSNGVSTFAISPVGALRKTGCLSLPSQRTLRDYTHFAKAVSGFSTAVDQQLRDRNMPGVEEVCVVVLLDEMHIREDLVYNNFTGTSYIIVCIVMWIIGICIHVISLSLWCIAGEFVGFTDLGDINTHVANFEAQLESGTVPTKPLAKSVLLNSGLQFPYAQFPCASLRGDQLFHIVRRAIWSLQRYGFHVLGLTCDGLAANQQMFRLHAPKGCSETVHKASNPFAIHFPSLLFFLIPHLLKMVRNCFASKNRHLWVRHSFTISKEGLYVVIIFIVILQFHHPISWSELFMASRHNIESLTVVPKLQYEHVFWLVFPRLGGSGM